MENSSRNFSEISSHFPHRPFYWKTHPFKIMRTYSVFFNSGASHRPFYWKTHPFDFFEWNHIWYLTFGLDEFSCKTACQTPHDSQIDDWMSFPVKRSQKFPRNLPIRVKLAEVFWLSFFLNVANSFHAFVIHKLVYKNSITWLRLTRPPAQAPL